MSPIIVARDVGKSFQTYSSERPRSVRELVQRGVRGFGSTGKSWALRHVDVELPSGQSLGIVGRNGSGKSTLMRLIGGLIQPDEGEIEVNASVSAFLSLSAGFRDDLSGIENAEVAAIVAGLTRREFRALADDIIGFAELESHAAAPLRTYSDGMRMRLAFAVAAHSPAGTILIDEVISVGDAGFRAKCRQRIREMQEAGTSLVIVSHDLAIVESHCDLALWLDDGRVRAAGATHAVLDEYTKSLGASGPFDAAGAGSNEASTADPDSPVQIAALTIRSESGSAHLGSGDAATVSMQLSAESEALDASAAISIGRPNEAVVIWLPFEFSLDESGMDRTITLDIERLDLAPGEYVVYGAVFLDEWKNRRAYTRLKFEVGGDMSGRGVLQPPHTWRISGD